MLWKSPPSQVWQKESLSKVKPLQVPTSSVVCSHSALVTFISQIEQLSLSFTSPTSSTAASKTFSCVGERRSLPRSGPGCDPFPSGWASLGRISSARVRIQRRHGWLALRAALPLALTVAAIEVIVTTRFPSIQIYRSLKKMSDDFILLKPKLLQSLYFSFSLIYTVLIGT